MNETMTMAGDRGAAAGSRHAAAWFREKHQTDPFALPESTPLPPVAMP